MALKSLLNLWDTVLGNVQFGSAQAAAVGASLGNGAAQFGQNVNNPLQIGDDGNLNVQIASAGINPGATGADNVLAVFSIPAGAFDIANRGINIMACGSMTAAASAKTVKIIVNPASAVVGSTVGAGGTTVASFSDSTATSAGGWQVSANLFKYGAAGSNTQIALHEASQSNTVIGALLAPSLITATETGNILVAITGNAAATGNITFNFLQIFAMN